MLVILAIAVERRTLKPKRVDARIPDLPVFASYQSSTVRSLRNSITEAIRVSIAYAMPLVISLQTCTFMPKYCSDAALLDVCLAAW